MALKRELKRAAKVMAKKALREAVANPKVPVRVTPAALWAARARVAGNYRDSRQLNQAEWATVPVKAGRQVRKGCHRAVQRPDNPVQWEHAPRAGSWAKVWVA